MKQNLIQFQHGMSMEEFQALFGKECQCEKVLENKRWPGGFICPACGQHNHSEFYTYKRKIYQCSICRHQTTVRAGTLFESSKLSLTKWFLAIYLISQDKNNRSALSLKRYLGVCYRTAWRLKHKLLETMFENEAQRKLINQVVADDAYLGGVHHGKRGRGSENKVPFMAAVQLSEQGHPLYFRFDKISNLKSASIEDWAEKAFNGDTHLITDGFSSLPAVKSVVAEHTSIIVKPKKSSEIPIFRWVNTIIGNVKRAISGTYHHVNFEKYASRYLAEAQYRLNHRFDLYTIVGELLGACVVTPPRPERWLRSSDVLNL